MTDPTNRKSPQEIREILTETQIEMEGAYDSALWEYAPKREMNILIDIIKDLLERLETA